MQLLIDILRHLVLIVPQVMYLVDEVLANVVDALDVLTHGVLKGLEGYRPLTGPFVAVTVGKLRCQGQCMIAQ